MTKDYSNCNFDKTIDFKKTYTEPLRTKFSGSKERADKVLDLLSKSASLSDVLSILRSHYAPDERNLFTSGSVRSVCMHQSLLGSHTTGSMAVEYNADEWSFLYFLGIGYFLNDDFESCVKVLTEATTRFDEKNDKAMAVEIYEMLGDALYSLDRKAEAFEAYEKCLKLDPDKISCLNNYAYYIAEEGGDIERAAEMSLKTVKAEPNNATYLDTYAWILFRQHRYEEAKIYIDLALKNLNKELDNSVIIEHGKQIETHLKKQ